MSEESAPAPEVPSSSGAAPASESVSTQESQVEIPAQATAGSTPDAPESIPAPSDSGATPDEAPAAIPAQSAVAPVDVAPAPVKPPRRRGGLIATVGVLLVVLLGLGGYYWFSYRLSPARADVGDCLSGSENPADAGNIKLTDCGDASATFRVLKKIENQLKPAASDQSACDGTLTTDTFWYGQEGKAGTILCLQKIHE